MRKKWLVFCMLGLVLVALPLSTQSKYLPATKAGKWVGTWVTMPQLTEAWNMPPEPFTQEGVVMKDTTLRQTFHVSIGGNYLRMRFTNAFSDAAFPITKAFIALPADGGTGGSAILPETQKALTFNGKTSVTIQAGAQVVSDPIRFNLKPMSNLAVTMYIKEGQLTNNNTSHPGSRTTSYLVAGDHAQDADLEGATSTNHWYTINGVEVWASRSASAVVIVGDSLTGGRGSVTNMNNRWPDLLSNNLRKNHATANIAVLNQGAGGNRVLRDGLGPNVLARFDRDVIAQSGVRWMILFEGINDIGTADATEEAQDKIAEELIDAYQQIITRAHAKDIKVFGATIIPFEGSFYFDETRFREAARQKVNNWIRTSGKFDAVIDFDKAIRDPENPTFIMPGMDDGDLLHLNPEGYQVLADAVPLKLFLKCR